MKNEMFQTEDVIDEASWDNQVCSLGGGLQHAGVYARYVSAGDTNAVPCYMSLKDSQGDLLGAAIGFRARSPHKLLRFLSGRMWLEAFPTIRSGVENGLLDFLRNVELYARSSGNTVLEVQSAASRSESEELAELGFDLRHRLEFVLDLQTSEDELWKGMAYKRRKNIKKAGRLAVTIRDLPGEEGIAALRRLQEDSSDRIVARGGPDITRKRSLAEDPVSVLLDAGVGRIVVAELAGQIVSASLFTHFNGHVYHTLSGHSDEGTKAQAPTLLLWETLNRYRSEGAKRFNLGGCSASAVEKGSPEHGVYDYKKAFGGECIECTSGRKVLHRIRYALQRAMKRIAGKN